MKHKDEYFAAAVSGDWTETGQDWFVDSIFTLHEAITSWDHADLAHILADSEFRALDEEEETAETLANAYRTVERAKVALDHFAAAVRHTWEDAVKSVADAKAKAREFRKATKMAAKQSDLKESGQ